MTLNKKIQLTQDGYDKLQLELDDLVNNKRPPLIIRVDEARRMGDLSENGAYTAARADLELLEGRIGELEHILQNAEIISIQTSCDVVDVGCKVTLDINGTHHEYTMVGDFEADPLKKHLSQTSPIGQAIMGKKKGDNVDVEVPAGKMAYKIKDIKKAD